MKYLAFILFFATLLIPRPTLAASINDCEQGGLLSYFGQGYSTLSCSCPGYPIGISYAGFTSDVVIDTEEKCKAVCLNKDTINPALGIEGYAMQCVVNKKLTEIARANFSGGAIPYYTSDCERVQDSNDPLISCECVGEFSIRQYDDFFHGKPASTAECRYNCLKIYTEETNNLPSYDRDSERVTGYSATCMAVDQSGTIDLAQETFSQSSIQNSTTDQCVSDVVCSCSGGSNPLAGSSAKLAQAGLQTSDPGTCQANCKQIEQINSGLHFTGWNLSCTSALGASLGGDIITIEKGNFNTTIASTSEKKCGDSFLAPKLGISIPGFNSDISQITCDSEGNVTNNLLGLYVSAVYKWLLGAGALIAVVMLMIAGVEWMLARGSANGISSAKKRIEGTMLGLALLFFAYTIAYWIDPGTVQFNSLVFQSVKQSEIPPLGETEVQNPDLNSPLTGDLVAINDPNILVANTNIRIAASIYEPLKAAATSLKASNNQKILISSGVRTAEHQLEVYYSNCIENGQTKCNVEVCLPIPSSKRGTLVTDARNQKWTSQTWMANTSSLANANVCPHTREVAVDAWCENGNFGKHIFDTDCQAALTLAMEKAGFCRLAVEPWHFELNPTTSASCSLTQDQWSYKVAGQSTIYNFQDCKRWDPANHLCVVHR